MQYLHFVMRVEGNNEIDMKVSYLCRGDIITFEVDEISYEVKTAGIEEFKRNTGTEEFVLRGDSTSTVLLKDFGKTFYIPVLYYNYEHDDKKISFVYELASDEGIRKEIIITFGN